MSKLAVSNGESRSIFTLKEGVNTIGRPDPETRTIPQVNLEVLDSEEKVSRKHAQLEVSGERILLEDLGSLNGTFLVNPLDSSQTTVELGRKYPLRTGDRFMIGKLFLQIID